MRDRWRPNGGGLPAASVERPTLRRDRRDCQPSDHKMLWFEGLSAHNMLASVALVVIREVDVGGLLRQ